MRNKQNIVFTFIVISLFITRMCYSQDESLPYINKMIIAKIKPSISKWLNFHNADLSKFRSLTPKEKPLCLEIDSSSLYDRPYTTEYDVYIPQFNDYSPNKKRYINTLASTGVFGDTDGKYHYQGGDDCQEIFLTDREKKENHLILWNGSGEFSEATFWVDNDTFIIAGTEDSSKLVFYLFELKNNTYQRYQLNYPFSDRTYFNDVNLKERGILTDTE